MLLTSMMKNNELEIDKESYYGRKESRKLQSSTCTSLLLLYLLSSIFTVTVLQSQDMFGKNKQKSMVNVTKILLQNPGY